MCEIITYNNNNDNHNQSWLPCQNQLIKQRLLQSKSNLLQSNQVSASVPVFKISNLQICFCSILMAKCAIYLQDEFQRIRVFSFQCIIIVQKRYLCVGNCLPNLFTSFKIEKKSFHRTCFDDFRVYFFFFFEFVISYLRKKIQQQLVSIEEFIKSSKSILVSIVIELEQSRVEDVEGKKPPQLPTQLHQPYRLTLASWVTSTTAIRLG